MKRILILSMLFLLINCTNEKKNILKIENYINLKFGKVEYEGKIIEYSTPYFIEKNDSLSKIIKKYLRRFDYLITNKIDVKSLNKILPDTLKAKKIFNKEISSESFSNNFRMLILPGENIKKTYSITELMNIASKFFLVEKQGEKYGTRVCIGINGVNKINKDKDYTLLESIVFDAIFERIMQFDKPEPKFMSKQSEYINKALSKVSTLEQKEHLPIIRESVYKSMENDLDLKKHLLEFMKTNEKNIPIKITMGNTVYN